MAFHNNPRIATDGLVCCLDAGNSKPSGVQHVSDFSAGADGWGAGAGGVVGNIDSIGGQDNNLRFTCNTTASSVHYIHFNNGGNWSSVGDTIRITFDYYIPAGQSNVDGIGCYTYGPTVVQPYYSQMNTTNAWTSIDMTFDVSQSYGFIIYGADGGANYFHDSGGDDVFYIRNFTYTEVTSQRRMSKRDLSGQGNHLVQSGTVYSSGPPEAFAFDGTDDYGTVGDLGTKPDWTVSCWWMSDTTNENTMFHLNSTRPQGFTVWSTANMAYYVVKGGGSTHTGTSYSWSTGKWYHLTLNHTSGTNVMLTYINGVQVDSDTLDVDAQHQSFNEVIIGDGGYGHWDGKIAAFHIYDRVLTAAEVKTNFNTHRARFGA